MPSGAMPRAWMSFCGIRQCRIHTRSLFPYTGHLVGRKFAFSIWMEFMGLMLFSLFGNSVTPEFAPAGNGEQRERSRNKSASV